MSFIGVIGEAILEAARALIGSRSSRSRQLAALRSLDDRLLADLGISRIEALTGRPSRARDE